MSFTLYQTIIVVKIFLGCGILWALMYLNWQQSPPMLVSVHPCIACCAVPTPGFVWAFSEPDQRTDPVKN